jgi:hypothetical protein
MNWKEKGLKEKIWESRIHKIMLNRPTCEAYSERESQDPQFLLLKEK